MAYTSGIKGFWYKKNLRPGCEAPMRIEVPLASSTGVALTIGDAVQLTSGYLTIAATGEVLLGILEGFVTANGENIFKTKDTLAGTKSGDDTYTPGASETVKGIVNIDTDALFFNQADSTLGQAEVGTWFATTAGSDQITGSGSTINQFQLVELVTTDESGAAQDDCGLFRIALSQLYVTTA